MSHMKSSSSDVIKVWECALVAILLVGFYLERLFWWMQPTSVPGTQFKVVSFSWLHFPLLYWDFCEEKHTQMELKIKQEDRNTFCLVYFSRSHISHMWESRQILSRLQWPQVHLSAATLPLALQIKSFLICGRAKLSRFHIACHCGSVPHKKLFKMQFTVFFWGYLLTYPHI